MNQGWANGQANMFQAGAAHMNPQSMYNNNTLPAGQPFDINAYNNNASQNGTPPQPGQQFPNPPPTFNPASVVPAKRSHDNGPAAGSPQQQTPNPHMSRSQTPSSYANFPPQQPPFPNAPTPYQHLQQPGSNNATPSPTMQNQQFRPPPPQQQPRMNNASPSPFPGQQPQQQQQQQQQQQPQQHQHQQQQQQQPGYGTAMAPGAPQHQPNNMQQGQMGQYAQQYAMNPGMPMPGMPMNNMSNMQQGNNAQRAYQMKLMQHQQQLRATGMLGPRGQPNQMWPMGAMPQAGAQMPNGQMAAQMQQAQQQQQQAKRAHFLKTLQSQAQSQGRPFNPTPTASGRPVDLYMLWTIVTSAGGSQIVDKNNQWPMVASKMGFGQPQFPSAAEELKQIHIAQIGAYERIWFQMRMQQKQQEARVHAQQMAGFSGPPQQSPTKIMQPPGQQLPYPQMQQGPQPQHPPQGTPVQANATLPQNGASTPQQMMGPTASMHHRRNSSLRKPNQMTPQPGATPGPVVTSPLMNKQQRPPTARQESGGVVMKSEEPQGTNYVPHTRFIDTDGGYDIPALYEVGSAIVNAMPIMPSPFEMGVIDIKAITLSLASGIHSEVRYALDTLVILTHNDRVRFELQHAEDLMDVLIDCAEEQTEFLSEEAAEVSDALDLPPYEDVLRGAKVEAEMLQDVPAFGTRDYDLDRAADKVIAITTILRNASFWEYNHRQLASPRPIKWLSNTIRLLGTRNMLLRTYYNTQDFFKDSIMLLSNITQSLELPSRDDALHILHFLLAFAPQPAPTVADGTGKVRFTSFSPLLHRYLPPAIDCLAKLLARQDPNRALYRSIFTGSSSSLAASESPTDLLTKAFGLSISVLPDRSKGSVGNAAQLRLVEARQAFLSQGMLAADILTTLAPANDNALARAWIESEDGWAVGLLNLAALLSVDRTQNASQKGREMGIDMDAQRLILHRALTMMKRLAEKAGRESMRHVYAQSHGVSNGTDVKHDPDGLAELLSHPRWEGIPQGHSILGALMMPNTDKVALGLLCGLHEMAMQHV